MKGVAVMLVAAALLTGCASASPHKSVTTPLPESKTAAASPAAAKPATAPAHAVAQPLGQAIDAFIAQPQFARADWGIAVRSLDTGKIIYTRNADRLFVPASNAKLFTAAMALATLGIDTRIATTLYATSTRVSAGGTLRGDLILYGRGDPSLGLKDVSPDWAERLAAALAERGVKRVRGDLIADATYFSGSPIGSGWEADDLQTWYGALPSALDVQGNSIKVDVAGTDRSCCSVTVTPDAAGVRIDNLTDDDNGTGDPPFGLYRTLGSSTVYAIGQLPPHVHRHRYVLSMPDPARTAGNLMRAALRQQGITVSGRLRVVHWPESDPALTRHGTQAIASIQSPPIAQLIDHMLKNSDNLYAQSLLLQVGVAAAQQHDCDLPRMPDTSAGWGLCALRGLLGQAGIPSSAVLMTEGSGLARRDLVSPNALVQWLTWAMTQPWAEDLRAALPVAGIDGTLEHRFRSGPATGNLQAKTGTLSHAYTLTGFVTDVAGQHLVFSLMLNRYPRWEVAREYPGAPSPQAALDTIANMLANAGVH